MKDDNDVLDALPIGYLTKEVLKLIAILLFRTGYILYTMPLTFFVLGLIKIEVGLSITALYWITGAGFAFAVRALISLGIENLKNNTPLATSAKALKGLRWFIPRTHREYIDLSIADIHRDIKEMRKERKSERFVQIYLQWHTFRTVVVVIMDAIYQSLLRLSPIANLWSRFSGGLKPKDDDES